jgi:streptogramin lyase
MMGVDLHQSIIRAGGDTSLPPDLGSIGRRTTQLRRRRTHRRAGLAVATVVVLGTIMAGLVPGGQPPRVVASNPTNPIRSVVGFPLPIPNQDFTHIVEGSDGNMWFTTTNSQIGRITPRGTITFFPLAAATIISGPDGNIWFGDDVERIGRLQVRAPNTVTFFALPPHVAPGTLTVGPDHNLWFSERVSTDPFKTTGQIGRITPTGSVTEFPPPPGAPIPFGIVTGPDHNLWFNSSSGQIGRITTGGHYTLFPVSAAAKAGGGGFGITAGPDGNLWFTEQRGDIGRITLQGVVTEFPSDGFKFGITVGPDHNLWFGTLLDTIGRVTTNGRIAIYPLDTPNTRGLAGSPARGPNNTLWVSERAHIVRITLASPRR